MESERRDEAGDKRPNMEAGLSCLRVSPSEYPRSFSLSTVLSPDRGTSTWGHQAGIGCPAEMGLLEYIRETRTSQERRRRETVLEQAESEAADRAEPGAAPRRW